MNKPVRKLSLLTACVLWVCTGCGANIYPDLPDDAQGFVAGTFTDTEHDDAAYGSIEYEGRTYIAYGVQGKTLHADDLAACIGYLVMNEAVTSVPDPDDRNTRIYTLTADPDRNFLMDCYRGEEVMRTPPSFWRAVDTKGKEIPVPDVINSQQYEFWDE